MTTDFANFIPLIRGSKEHPKAKTPSAGRDSEAKLWIELGGSDPRCKFRRVLKTCVIIKLRQINQILPKNVIVPSHIDKKSKWIDPYQDLAHTDVTHGDYKVCTKYVEPV